MSNILYSQNIISAEKFQQIADVFLGLEEDFNLSDPKICSIKKRCNINDISLFYNNPRIVFCFSNRLNILSEKIKYFNNQFILITHNGNDSITCDNECVINILNCQKLIKWFAKNLCFDHNKLCILPSGIANRTLIYGSSFLKVFDRYDLYKLKNKEIYMSFTIGTNVEKRVNCYKILLKKIKFLPMISSYNNFLRFMSYKYCICPEGEGIDTYRIWEALYFNIVPIVLRNHYMSILEKNFPIVVLDKWEDFDIDKLPPYETFDFGKIQNFLNIDFYKNMILSSSLSS